MKFDNLTFFVIEREVFNLFKYEKKIIIIYNNYVLLIFSMIRVGTRVINKIVIRVCGTKSCIIQI